MFLPKDREKFPELNCLTNFSTNEFAYKRLILRCLILAGSVWWYLHDKLFLCVTHQPVFTLY